MGLHPSSFILLPCPHKVGPPAALTGVQLLRCAQSQSHRIAGLNFSRRKDTNAPVPLKLFNTLSRSTQDFVPLDPAGRRVGLYCCGPTVHDFAHIGNFRTFVFADLVRRYLQFKGFDVRHVMNITDVEDKIIKRVNESHTPLRENTAKYEAAFFEDFDTLGCLRPHETPRATEHMADIIALIQRLVDRGIAYRAADGSVYFSIEKYQAGGGRYG